ncbi:MAG TPA: rod shape-determining protein MreC [Dehalococcoidia bacterium]|nr:rod shape-determining protein MreC [Dehalococcoidia bacterium]
MRLIWWFATVAVVSFFTIVLSQTGALDTLRNLTLTVTAPVENGIRDAASPLSDIYEGIADRGDLVRENEGLREENEQLAQQIANQEAAQNRIRELEAALGVKEQNPDFIFAVGNVFARDPSSLKRVIAINLGTSDGIDEGMVVLSGNGSLVGTVSLALADYSWVRLINDPDSSVNAQVHGITLPTTQNGGVLTPDDAQDQEGGEQSQEEPTPAPEPSTTPAPQPVRGVAEGDLRNDIILDLLPSEAPIDAGALVVTSGLGGNYPPNLLIGSITDVEQRPQAPFKKARVDPATKLDGLDTILVITNFKPARLQAP